MSADVLTIARNTRKVTHPPSIALLLVSCPPFSTYGLGVQLYLFAGPCGFNKLHLRSRPRLKSVSNLFCFTGTSVQLLIS